MTRAILLTAAIAASIAPAAVHAQPPAPAPAPAAVAVVDVTQLIFTCRQCRVASTALQEQADALRARFARISAAITTEGQALQALVAALPQGRQPDPALRARILRFQSRRERDQRDITQRRDRIQRVLDSVRLQIAQRMQPAITTAMRRHGATDYVDRTSVQDMAGRIDITAEVLAIVDQDNRPFDLHDRPMTAPPSRLVPAAQAGAPH